MAAVPSLSTPSRHHHPAMARCAVRACVAATRLNAGGRGLAPALLSPASPAAAAAAGRPALTRLLLTTTASAAAQGGPPSPASSPPASYRTATWPPRRPRPAAAASPPGAPAATKPLEGSDVPPAATTPAHTPPAASGAASEEDYAKLVVPPPPPPSVDAPGWAGQAWARSPLDVRRRIFCNRSLNMASIEAVGFDMDYTLAQYKPDTFEALAYRLTVDKLVTVFGYPAILREFEFDWRYMTRGLVIDKKRGNVLKVDRHKYVKLAYHGFRPLSRAERLATYANAGGAANGLDEPDYALIDTLFSLAEAHLFMQLVELAEAVPGSLPASSAKDGWAGLYRDVRAAVDLCHRDGSLKSAVAASPATYIHEDRRLAPLLDTLRASGRRIFLATNSLWDYTHVVMNYLLCGRAGADKDGDWLSYFDVVVTGCGKPAFFTEKRPLFEVVDPATGLLSNTDGGSPMVPIGEADLPRPGLASTAPADLVSSSQRTPTLPSPSSSTATPPPPLHGPGARRARVFQGGTYLDLHRMLGVGAGTEVLYVGDHIYGDILRSKKSLGWRTMLVVPELEAELDILSRSRGAMAELRTLRAARDALEDQIQRLEWAVVHGAGAAGVGGEGEEEEEEDPDALSSSSSDGAPPVDTADYPALIANLKSQRDGVRAKHRALLRSHHERFHAVWGRLLKTGYQNSRFAHQVERFACLYTSHVSNLHFVSPDKSFRATPDHMAHEYDPLLSDAVPDGDGGWGGAEGKK
jgi:HAD superfamily 5'-nucleotidase-like hydrolase